MVESLKFTSLASWVVKGFLGLAKNFENIEGEINFKRIDLEARKFRSISIDLYHFVVSLNVVPINLFCSLYLLLHYTSKTHNKTFQQYVKKTS